MKTKIYILLLFIIPNLTFSQVLDSTNTIDTARPRFIAISLGKGATNLRDFATSPLVYKGGSTQMSLSYIRKNDNRYTEMGFNTNSGKLVSDFNSHVSESHFQSYSISYDELFKVNYLSSDKFNTKVGGLATTTGVIRSNPSLQNNAFGMDLFATLFLSAKTSWDISRKEVKHKKFLFIKYTLNPRKKDLALRMNVGLLNSTYRNGYAYSGQSAVENDPVLMDGYGFSFASGFRMSSSLDYTVYLKNHNGFRLSYLWSAYKTGGDDHFEMANHSLRFTFLFNTNNK